MDLAIREHQMSDNGHGSGADNQEKTKSPTAVPTPGDFEATETWRQITTVWRQQQVFRDERVESATLLVLLMTLAVELGENNECELANDQLSAMVRMTERTLSKRLPDLEALGYIERIIGVGHTPTVYHARGRWLRND